MSIDDLDIRLVEALSGNARVTNKSLAAHVGLSESACRTRVQNLERAGLILGYRAVIAFDKIGIFHTWVDVTLADDSARTIGLFEDVVARSPEIIEAHIIEGPSQFRLEVAVDSYESWQAFAGRVLALSGVVRAIQRNPIYKACRTQRGFEG